MESKRKQFENVGYNVSIIGKNIRVTPALRNYIMEKIQKVDRLTDHIIDLSVTLEVQKLTYSVSITMKFYHFLIKIKAETEEMYSAIDRASDKLFKLIRKYKTKLLDHHNKEHETIDLNVKVYEEDVSALDDINDEIMKENLKKEEEKYRFHSIKAHEKIPLKILTQDEAIMKLELSGDHFLVFKGQEDQKLKVIYRREDQNFGIIDVGE
jgi:putative sigma-54 modulation protein